MNRRLAIAIIALTAATLHAQAPLDKVLTQLDAASKTFKSAQADVQYDNYTRVVRAHDIETGSIFIERAGSSENMGAIFFDAGARSPSKVLSYDGGSLQIYTPGVNQVDVFKAGANQAKYESFLTLGFGGSGSALAKAWTITDQGPETIDSTRTEKLDLVSKDPNVTAMFTHVTIWVDPTRGLSLKQVFVAPNGDMRTALYTNVKLNAGINKKPYAISSKASRINH